MRDGRGIVMALFKKSMSIDDYNAAFDDAIKQLRHFLITERGKNLLLASSRNECSELCDRMQDRNRNEVEFDTHDGGIDGGIFNALSLNGFQFEDGFISLQLLDDYKVKK